MLENLKEIFYTEMNSPIGPLTIAATDKGICWLGFGSTDSTLFTLTRWGKRWINSDYLIEDNQNTFLLDARKQLTEYFNRKRSNFDLSLDIYGTEFQKLVLNSLLTIPYGEVRSYKDIAIQIRSPKSVRAVGGANHNNPISIIIPCHRVIGSNGNLVGYGGGIEVKQYLLELEGFFEKRKNAL